MRYLKTNTAVRITVGPFLDITDGITPLNSITVTNSTCELFHDVDTGGAAVRAALTLSASAGDNDMIPIASGVGGYYDLELTQTNVNFLGRAMLSIIDTDVHLPVFHEFMVVPAMVYDTMILGTDYMDAQVKAIDNNAITANSINADAITNAKIADDAIALENFADGAIGAVTFASGAIDATALAANAVDEIVADILVTPSQKIVTDASGYVTANVNGDLTATMKTSVNTQVVDALGIDTLSEMSQGIPPSTPTMQQALMYLYMAWRNEVTRTTTTYNVKNDSGSIICKATLSDDGTTFTKAEFVSGP